MKFISKIGRTEKELRTLRREIEIMKSMHHDNIVEMIDTFETQNEVALHPSHSIPFHPYSVSTLILKFVFSRRFSIEKCPTITVASLFSSDHRPHRVCSTPLFSTDFNRFTGNPAVTISSPCFSQKRSSICESRRD